MKNNAKVLITGGTGVLGEELSGIFSEHDIPCRIASRTNPSGLENWVRLDLATSEGLDEATEDIDTIFHLASGTMKFNREIDVEGTKRLLEAAAEKGVSHFVYISIVGVDKVPIPYYRYKWEAENEVRKSGIPYSILRATQFHSFIDEILSKFLKFPIGFLPKKIKVQPIETQIVAHKLFELGQHSPLNDIIQLGGKEIRTLEELAKDQMRIRKKKKWLLNIPLFGKLKKTLYSGALTCTERTSESKSYEEWLVAKYT